MPKAKLASPCFNSQRRALLRYGPRYEEGHAGGLCRGPSIAQLGYDHEREEAEAQAAREATALELKNKSAAAMCIGAKQEASSSSANAADVEKLGNGS